LNINIIDITQTILSGNFVMMMMVDLTGSAKDIGALKADLDELSKKLGVSISVLHEGVFRAMHRL
jgi:ACT domain-containing protein